MRLKQILQETRQWAEQYAFDNDYSDDLLCMCSIVSKELFERLKQYKYKCQLAYNYKHCFVLYRGYILDLTATQFGDYPEIYITRKFKFPFHHIQKIFNTSKALTNYQKRNGWPINQI
jgi:hypothetical protein